MSIYQRNPDAPPDSEFEPGMIHHLEIGNRGRLLDPRRTPISIVARRLEVGTFVLRIEDFEDRGATWEIPFEEVDRYQFALGSARVRDDELRRMRAAIERLDRSETIECDPDATRATAARIADRRAAAAAWLDAQSSFLAGDAELPDAELPDGRPELYRDLVAYMEGLDLKDVEHAFAEQYVRAPHSGEIVKGHRIVVAELGLVPYTGKVVRDPATFAGRWSRERRADHVTARMGFVSALFTRLGRTCVTLYRGISTDRALERPPNDTFVSTSFSRAVCESHFDSAGPDSTGVLLRQAVPIERVFMTYLETSQMNERYREAEAVLLFDADNRAF